MSYTLKDLSKKIETLEKKVNSLTPSSTWPDPVSNQVRVFTIQSASTGEYLIAAFIDMLAGIEFSGCNIQGSNLQWVLSSNGTGITFNTYATPPYNVLDVTEGNPMISTISILYPDGRSFPTAQYLGVNYSDIITE